MSWRPAVPLDTVPDVPLEAVWVDQAIITPLRTGPIALADRQWWWMTGAVHDASGNLVKQSQRLKFSHDWPPMLPVDPDRVRVPGVGPRLSGTWVFAGHWARHFGHFLLETLPNLWPAQASTAEGIVAIKYPKRTGPALGGPGPAAVEPSAQQQELLELAGFGGRDIMLSRHRLVHVDRLLVPERPTMLGHWVRPEGVAMWRRISDAVGARGAARKVLLSRSRFNAVTGRSSGGLLRTDARWDARLDRAFAAAGFDVVFPEELSVREQIALVRGADVIAGSRGTALHLSCFADPGTRVLEIGDNATVGGKRYATQQAIDAACGHSVDFLAYGDVDALGQLGRLDVEGLPDRSPPQSAQRTAPGSARRLARRVLNLVGTGTAEGRRRHRAGSGR